MGLSDNHREHYDASKSKKWKVRFMNGELYQALVELARIKSAQSERDMGKRRSLLF